MRKLSPDSNSMTVIFKAPPALIEQADDYARAMRTSRSWVIRAVLQAHFDQMPTPGVELQQEAAE
jgi:predicted transcriptional regulator